MSEIKLAARTSYNDWPRNVSVFASSSQYEKSIHGAGDMFHSIASQHTGYTSLAEAYQHIIFARTTLPILEKRGSNSNYRIILPQNSSYISPDRTQLSQSIWNKNSPNENRMIVIIEANPEVASEGNSLIMNKSADSLHKIARDYNVKSDNLIHLKNPTLSEISSILDRCNNFSKENNNAELLLAIIGDGKAENDWSRLKHSVKNYETLEKFKQNIYGEGSKQGIIFLNDKETLKEGYLKEEALRKFNHFKGVMIWLNSCYSGAWLG
jgi:hypothetical protein